VGEALLWGEPRLLRRGGNPPAPAFPGGETGKGRSDSLLPQALSAPCSHRRFALLPFALLSGAFAPVPFGVLNINGCCHLGIELKSPLPEPSFHRDLAVTRTRRLGYLNTTESLRPLSPAADYSSAARTLHRSPISDAAGSPAFSPPPPSPFSLRSCRRAPPASSPTASDPYPAPASP